MRSTQSIVVASMATKWYAHAGSNPDFRALQFDSACGLIGRLAAMPYGSLAMHADAEHRHFAIESANEEQLARLKYVVDAHIVRFAFREKLEKLDWR